MFYMSTYLRDAKHSETILIRVLVCEGVWKTTAARGKQNHGTWCPESNAGLTDNTRPPCLAAWSAVGPGTLTTGCSHPLHSR